MIIQQIDSLGRYVAMGVGTVLCREGDEPIRIGEVKEKGVPKISFTLTTGAKRSADGHMSYQNVICAVYGNKFNADMYEYAATLTRNERVFFAGYIFQRSGKDNETGEDILYSEVVLEFLVSAKSFYGNVIGSGLPSFGTGTDREDDEYSF